MPPQATGASDTLVYYLKGTALMSARAALTPVSIDTSVSSVHGCLMPGAATNASDTLVYYLKSGTLMLRRAALTAVTIDSGVTSVAGTHVPAVGPRGCEMAARRRRTVD